ncbi:MAG: ribosome maturation factor RimP [Erysipelotrichia bacterium]|nr:ribosome maturation factor RimP [Erysipelotrichia bacterium]NCC53946.1 ribosome maturation factor RimP [Erysipelotrichia bacterium]
MDQISQLKEKIEQLIQEDGISLYDVKWTQDGKMKILQVSIMKSDGTMDIDTCASVSSKISDMLDVDDRIPFEYYLEVCSPGAERELRNEQEVIASLNEYVFIKFVEPKDGMDAIKGYLRAIHEDSYLIEYQDKAVKKKKEIAKENVAFIRLSVKI